MTGSPVLDAYSESENPSLPPDVEIVYTNDSGIDETLTVRFDRWERTGIAPGDEAEEAIEFSNEHFGPRPQPPPPGNWPVGAGAGPAPSGGRRQTRRKRQQGSARVRGDLYFDVYVDGEVVSENRLREIIPSLFNDMYLSYERPILTHVGQNGYEVDRLTEIMEDHLNYVAYVEKPDGVGMPPDLELSPDAVADVRITFTRFKSTNERLEEDFGPVAPAAAWPVGAGAGPAPAGLLLPRGRRAREREAQREPVGEPSEVSVEKEKDKADDPKNVGGRRRRRTRRNGKKSRHTRRR